MILPMSYWKLTESVDEVSARLFERGIRFVFTGMRVAVQRGWSDQTPEWKDVERMSGVLEQLEPLISAVPRHLLKDALSHGCESSDPVVRSVCVLRLTSVVPS
jgi:hypothetical protein